jgi:acetoin utilization deacetylase AcuC-like enzyme
MISFHHPAHAAHAPEFEFFRGERVPCFETPARAEFVLARLRERGHRLQQPGVDSLPLLRQVHAARYLDFLQTAWRDWVALDPANAQRQPFPSVWPVRSLRHDREPANFTGRLGLYSMDNGSPFAAGTWEAAKGASDAAATAAAWVMGALGPSSGRAGAASPPAAFCSTRPPGHHAGADFMGGYCFLNHAAVAAQALRGHGAQRVAVLDVDYHHGNGTQSIFYARSDVLFVSIHGDPRTEYPFYLGHADETGEGEGAGFNLNLPLAARSSAATWFEALDAACARIAATGSEALVVSLGLDTFGGDPISSFQLQAEDFTRLGARLARLGLPTVFVLEGGYAAAELGVNAVNVVEGFEHGAGVMTSRAV